MIVTLHQEIALQSPGLDRQHQVSSSFHGAITDHPTPHLQRVAEEGVFAATFLILGIGRFKQAFGERMAVIPIECP